MSDIPISDDQLLSAIKQALKVVDANEPMQILLQFIIVRLERLKELEAALVAPK